MNPGDSPFTDVAELDGDPRDLIARRLILNHPWSDAWLLLALIYAREPADRGHLRAVGDFINHAIFTDEELEGGLERLVRSGHAIVVDDRFAPGPGVLDWYDEVTAGKSRTAVLKDLERVQTYLGTPPG